mgnify:CR=1 FL=1|tara:strand:+ start:88 stop:918 length:831 start_codon:yes stop_codon:yes gene_type:complete
MGKKGKRSRRAEKRKRHTTPHKISGGLALFWNGTALPKHLSYLLWNKINDATKEVYGDMKTDNYDEYKDALIKARNDLDEAEQELCDIAKERGVIGEGYNWNEAQELAWMCNISLLLFSGRKETQNFGVCGYWKHDGIKFTIETNKSWELVCEKVRKRHNYHADDTFEEEMKSVSCDEFLLPKKKLTAKRLKCFRKAERESTGNGSWKVLERELAGTLIGGESFTPYEFTDEFLLNQCNVERQMRAKGLLSRSGRYAPVGGGAKSSGARQWSQSGL